MVPCRLVVCFLSFFENTNDSLVEASLGCSCKCWDVVFVRERVEVDVQKILACNPAWVDRGVEKSYEMANDVWIIVGKVDNAVVGFLFRHQYRMVLEQ